MSDEQRAAVIRLALEMRARAYAPYSHYHVGAAVLTDDGRLIGGCNVENASYGLSNCAERGAIFAAIAQGARGFARSPSRPRTAARPAARVGR